MFISSCQIIQLPKIIDKRGNLSFIEELQHIPFIIKRSYWIYDVPGGESRGGHAFKTNQEFLVSLSGSFDIKLYDGKSTENFTLNRSYYGIYIPNGVWREINNFSTNSVAFFLSSSLYDKNDYIFSITEFDNFKK